MFLSSVATSVSRHMQNFLCAFAPLRELHFHASTRIGSHPISRKGAKAQRIFRKKYVTSTVIIAFALLGGACAALRPPDTGGPRADVRLYPIGLADPAARLEEASLAWYQISQHYGLQQRTEANLDPFTATLQSLPTDLAATIQLPKVGDAQPTEEQVRESLRRFIAEWQRLIGAAPQELSLVERTDEAGGTKLARYEQRPFRYPLRGGYGNLMIRFRNDGKLIALSSNCLPNAERIQSALNQISPGVTREEAVARVKAQPITVSNTTGQQTITLPDNAVLDPGQLVVYALPHPNQSPGQSRGLELHLAWEISVTNGPIKKIYFDAVTSQVIAAT